ncbi:hypothetical protein HN836_03525 [Candidatus Woesearchaeota archaeon]|mgnify:CR=1 FL=1|jgi:hypothetical protein|nr:hypothetical protein [Candidatus Woesearchaeota archaeon]
MIKNTFTQLIVLYTIAIILILINVFGKFSIQLNIASLIIALTALPIIKKTNLNLPDYLIAIPIILTLALRIIPYINNSIPLGYDAGIYKYGIETFQGINSTEWAKGTFTPIFIYLTTILRTFFTTDTILIYVLILINLLIPITLYITTKEYFNKSIAIISTIIYSLSIIQFKLFSYLYFKNIMAIPLLLLTFYFYKKNKSKLFILTAALTGATHRPTFLILILSYFALTIKQKSKKDLINLIKIGILTLIFYLGFIKQAILPLIAPVTQSLLQPGTSPGTFIDFFTYQYSILTYLPFALIGLFYLIKQKDYNLIFFSTIISLAIVYFQFFFFNRFIIHLDLFLIILAGVGFSTLIQYRKKIGALITIILLISAGVLVTQEALNTKPLINKEELETIKQLQNTEEGAYVMATASLYSPYVLGYSGRKTIAPGLFEYNQHNKAEWTNFWTTKDLEEIKQFLNKYNKPLYIYVGAKQPNNIAQFNQCFETYYEQNNNKIYKYTC